MAKLCHVRKPDGSTWGFTFECPGCKETHPVPTTGDHAWSFNDDVEKPTFTPSILKHEVTKPDGSVYSPRCHSFVRDGRIEFCSDSGHALAGQTVDLPDVEA